MAQKPIQVLAGSMESPFHTLLGVGRDQGSIIVDKCLRNERLCPANDIYITLRPHKLMHLVVTMMYLVAKERITICAHHGQHELLTMFWG